MVTITEEPDSPPPPSAAAAASAAGCAAGLGEASTEADDVAELRALLTHAKRPRVRQILEREIAALQQFQQGSSSPATEQQQQNRNSAGVTEGEKAPAASSQTTPAAAPAAAPVRLHAEKAVPTVHYTAVPSFSWDQDGDRVKVYLSVEGATQDRAFLNVTSTSVDLRLNDVGTPSPGTAENDGSSSSAGVRRGRNLRFGVARLSGAVVPEKCSVVVKPKRVTISLKKKDRGHWADLHYKEDKFKPKTDTAKTDPMAGIMDLMKNMYEDGDEEMKRTIAKAWTEARTGKAGDPMAGMGGGMGSGFGF